VRRHSKCVTLNAVLAVAEARASVSHSWVVELQRREQRRQEPRIHRGNVINDVLKVFFEGTTRQVV